MTMSLLAALVAFGQTPVQTPQQPVATPVQTPTFTMPANVQTAASGPVLTLDEAVQIARKNAFDIATGQSQVRQTQDRLNQAKGLIGPKVTANASDVHQFN